MCCIQDHISAWCLTQRGTRCSAANPASCPVAPSVAPALQPEPLATAADPDSEGLAQTVQDGFSHSAFMTLASQLPSLVTDNCVFEVQIQRVQALCFCLNK